MRIVGGLVLVVMAGCTGDLLEIGTSKPDLSFGAVDMSQGGGGEMGPTAKFSPDIQMDLDAKGCTAGGACHGNAQTPVMKAMATGAQLDTNYMNLVANTCMQGKCIDLMNPPASLLLTKNIPPGHTGGMLLNSTSDPTYLKWLAWIQAGAPKQ